MVPIAFPVGFFAAEQGFNAWAQPQPQPRPQPQPFHQFAPGTWTGSDDACLESQATADGFSERRCAQGQHGTCKCEQQEQQQPWQQ
eukprot:3941339-Karenia_brevis.AAC.1